MLLALVSLAATIGIETVLVCHLRPPDRARLRIDAPLINLATHPLATIAVGSLALPFAGVEIAVIGVEALAYRFVTGLPPGRAAWLSLAANGVTIAIAVALRGLL